MDFSYNYVRYNIYDAGRILLFDDKYFHIYIGWAFDLSCGNQGISPDKSGGNGVYNICNTGTLWHIKIYGKAHGL